MSGPAPLDRIPALRDALRATLPRTRPCHLVGGALRNALLGLPVTDFDLTLQGDPGPAAREFARRTGGRWFVLDAPRHQSRVIVKQNDSPGLTFDFAPWRAADLAGDLRLRDVTANALAQDLHRGELVDPLHGALDIAARTLRVCSDRSFSDDPLRLLRVVRLAQTIDFTVEEGTWSLLCRQAGLLAAAPAERVGDELVLMLNASGLDRAWALLEAAGLDRELLGERSGEDREPGCAGDSLARLEAFAQRLAAERPGLAELADQGVGRGLRRRGRLRLAAILRGRGACPATETLTRRLALGRENAAVLRELAGAIAVPAGEPEKIAATHRARALWADRFGNPVDVLLFLAAFCSGLGAREQLLERLEAWLALQWKGRVPDLVTGHWLVETLGLAPGPGLGRVLARVREGEIRGAVLKPSDIPGWLRAAGEKSVDNKNGPPL